MCAPSRLNNRIRRKLFFHDERPRRARNHLSSGLSKRLNRILDNAEDNGTPVVLITSNPESPLVARSTYVIMTSQRDRLFAYGVPFSHNSVNFIIEVLFLFLHASSTDVAEHIKLFTHAYDDLDKAIRLPQRRVHRPRRRHRQRLAPCPKKGQVHLGTSILLNDISVPGTEIIICKRGDHGLGDLLGERVHLRDGFVALLALK